MTSFFENPSLSSVANTVNWETCLAVEATIHEKTSRSFLRTCSWQSDGHVWPQKITIVSHFRIAVCGKSSVWIPQNLPYSGQLMSCQTADWICRGVVVSSGPSPLASLTFTGQGFGFLVSGGGYFLSLYITIPNGEYTWSFSSDLMMVNLLIELGLLSKDCFFSTYTHVHAGARTYTHRHTHRHRVLGQLHLSSLLKASWNKAREGRWEGLRGTDSRKRKRQHSMLGAVYSNAVSMSVYHIRDPLFPLTPSHPLRDSFHQTLKQ